VNGVSEGNIHCALGASRHGRADFAGALEEFDKAIEVNAECAEAWNNRGATRHRMGHLGGALADINRALELNPLYAEAYNNRGIVRQVMGDLVGALADYHRAVEIRPRYAEALTSRAALRQSSGDLLGALADFDRAIGIRSDYAEAYLGRADALHAWGDLEAAIADYDRVLQLIPRQAAAPVHHLRAGVRFSQRRFAEVLADCNAALEIDPGLCMAYISRGNARYHLREASALADYRTAFQMDRQAAAAEIIRFLAEDLRRNADEVFENCRKHIRISPDDAAAYARRGLSLILQGKEAEAAPDFEAGSLRHPDWKEDLDFLIQTARAQRSSLIPGDNAVIK